MKDMEPFSIRRARLTDADKVRYRVYTNPVEYVAVIAESALMAVRVSGIKAPYKIMRDLPANGVSIDANRITAREESTETASFMLEQEDQSSQLTAEMPDLTAETAAPFVPVTITDLQYKGSIRARILPPELVHQIIEEHTRAAQPMDASSPPPAAAEPVAPQPEPEPLAAEPELSSAEKITQLASEVELPSASELKSSDDSEQLSPEEVEKLLNE